MPGAGRAAANRLPTRSTLLTHIAVEGTILATPDLNGCPCKRVEARDISHRRLAGAVLAQAVRNGNAWSATFEREAIMDNRTKEHALEYALILGVGALLLVLVFINIHSHIIV